MSQSVVFIAHPGSARLLRVGNASGPRFRPPVPAPAPFLVSAPFLVPAPAPTLAGLSVPRAAGDSRPPSKPGRPMIPAVHHPAASAAAEP